METVYLKFSKSIFKIIQQEISSFDFIKQFYPHVAFILSTILILFSILNEV